MQDEGVHLHPGVEVWTYSRTCISSMLSAIISKYLNVLDIIYGRKMDIRVVLDIIYGRKMDIGVISYSTALINFKFKLFAPLIFNCLVRKCKVLYRRGVRDF